MGEQHDEKKLAHQHPARDEDSPSPWRQSWSLRVKSPRNEALPPHRREALAPRETSSPPGRLGDRVVSGLLLLVGLAMAVLAVPVGLYLQLEGAYCNNSCSTGGIVAGSLVAAFLPSVALVVFGSMTLRRLSRRELGSPLAALVVVAVALSFIVGYQLVEATAGNA